MLVRNEKAYHRIVGRQYRTKWGSDYDPSIRATPKEAPGSSTASTLMSESMGRLVHVLSRNELKVALIALYNPAVWYIRDAMREAARQELRELRLGIQARPSR